MGKTVPVLFEEERDGLWYGHTPRYCEAAAEYAADLHNRTARLRVERVEGNTLMGTLES